MTEGIGIAGSGRLARPFLSRLKEAGIAAAGLAVAGSDGQPPADTSAAGLRTLILVPRDIAESEALLFATEGFARAVPTLETIVIAATLSPRYVRALRGRIDARIALVDAPSSGTMRRAEEGRLCFHLGGDPEAIARLRPIFDILGNKAVRMGGFGAAMAAKVLTDLLTASSTALTRIALDWAAAQGIDEAQMLDLTEASLGPPLLTPCCDLTDTRRAGPGDDDGVATLVESVEAALDAALKGAHLTPPLAMHGPFGSPRSRALH